jgi:endoglycosylceramidase
VSGGFLRAPDGRAAILRGANVTGAQKAPPYLDPAFGADDYARLRSVWGMNAMRFLMTWAAVEPRDGEYDDAYLDGVAERMRWAEAAGLAVILDMHEDVYGEGFGFDGAPRWTCDEARYAAFTPKQPWFVNSLDPNVEACVDGFYTDARLQEKLVAAWRHVAERLARAPAVIGFDVLNEPAWGSYSIFDFEADRLRPLYQAVVRAVRGAAPSWVAFLEPAASRNAGIPTGLTRFPFGNVVYAPHVYDQAAEGGADFDAARADALKKTVAQLAGEARALDAALWIGEYGGNASSPGIGDYMRAIYDGAGAQAASSIYWELGRDGGYGMLAPDGTEKPALLDVLVRPYPARVAGDPIDWSFDGAVFTLRYRPASGTTEIVVPARVFPNGYSVDCGGCAYEKAGDLLRITRAGGSTVTLSP